MTRARLREDYRVQYPDPIRVEAGAAVTVTRRDDQFTQWLWCQASDGREGWVPETILSSTAPGPARVSERYEATELPAREGDLVEIITEFDGFARVRSEQGRLGWLPVTVLAKMDEEPSDG
jgi:SH3-like domain-containing protein